MGGGADGAGGTAWFWCGPEKAEEAECEVPESGDEQEECLIVSPSGSGECVWTADDESARIERRFDKASKGGLAGGGAFRGDAS